MIIVIFGIGIIGAGVTGSAFAQTDNQTKSGQDKNNTNNGSGIMDKIGDIAKEKLKEGVQEIMGGSNNK